MYSRISLFSLLTLVVLVMTLEFTEVTGTRRHRNDPSGDSSGGNSRRHRSAGGSDGSGGHPSTTAASYNCTQCGSTIEPGVNRDAKRNYRLESIKADILRKLHLRAPPNITGRRLPALPHIQQLIDKLSTHQNDEGMTPGGEGHESLEGYPGGGEGLGGWEAESDDDRATTMKVIQVSRAVPTDRVVDQSQYNNICYFPFPMSEVRYVQQIVSVNFGLYVRPVTFDPVNPSRPTWLLVYMLRPTGERRLLKKKLLALNRSETGRWYHFHLPTAEIQHWITDPASNYGLHIQSSNGRGDPLAIVTPQNDLEEPFRPYIEVETSELTVSRSKRTIDMNCDERSTERRCCRYPLTVDFNSFQWDWVIVPKRYSAFYCSGECPFLFMQQDAHTHVNQMARGSSAVGGGPCCSPRKVSSISMLYYDEHMNIVYGRLPGMVVDRCGCS